MAEHRLQALLEAPRAVINYRGTCPWVGSKGLSFERNCVTELN